jgi:histidinol dehydrogenase
VRVRRIELASDAPAQVLALARTIRALATRPPELEETVAGVLADVRARGDAAVLELTRRFDSPQAGDDLRVSPDRMKAALVGLDLELRAALDVAITNVRQVAEAELGLDVDVELPQGHRIQLREFAIDRAGVYVPGGGAAYPSTVVMCCVPAAVAGVKEVAVATPPGPDGDLNHVVLAACALCGVDEVYAMGGAQAIAALAFGTATVESVDVIVGPGNHYVQEAKRQLAGIVGIDGVAGPSELVVVADETADAELVALDLCAQAEHGPDSLVAVLSADEGMLDAVAHEAERISKQHDSIADTPLALVRAPDLAAAIDLAGALAPEHLELACADAESRAERTTGGACVFVGGGAAFGDYAAGSNHVLPTGGAARYTGPLGPGRFRRRQALVSLPEPAARALAPEVSSLARAEGFPLHAESAEARNRAQARKA